MKGEALDPESSERGFGAPVSVDLDPAVLPPLPESLEGAPKRVATDSPWTPE